MILDERSAAVFINGYRQLLLEICGPTGADFKLLERLVEGRRKLKSDGSLLDGALSRIRSQAQSVDEAVVAAAASLQVNSWVYLRDTRRYSVFLDPAGEVAYGTLGITEPIKELVGGAGALIETGLLFFDGRIVCDGLVPRWCGSVPPIVEVTTKHFPIFDQQAIFIPIAWFRTADRKAAPAVDDGREASERVLDIECSPRVS